MNTAELFLQISLSEAAYANLIGLDINSSKRDLVDALLEVDNGFSQSQAEEFVKHWRVVSHQPDTGSGFSATLFESIDNPGELTFAVRGTGTFLQDLALTDTSDIVLDGIAIDQVVDMYNYWQRLKAPTNENYQVARLVGLPDLAASLTKAYLKGKDIGEALVAKLAKQPGLIIDLPNLTVKTVVFEQSSKADGLGNIPANLNGINVAGHSLGGHLAMAFTRLFSGANFTAYTVNAAGFRIHFNVDNLLNALAQKKTHFDNGKIINLYGTAGPNFVTQDVFYGLNQEGIRIPIFTESALKGKLGHGVGQVTDSAMVYDLMFALDHSLQELPPIDAVNRLTPIFDAASYEKNFSVESLVNSLGKLLAPGFIRIERAQEDNRDILYSHIQPLRQAIFVNPDVPAPVLNPEYQGLTVTSLTNSIATELKLKAEGESLVLTNPEDAIAYRYALNELNPFVITGNNSIYDNHNSHEELNLANFSDEYLSDRSDFLAFKIELGLTDNDIKTGAANITYTDIAQNFTLNINKPAGAGQLPHQKIIFTSSQTDESWLAQGGNQADRLYGFFGNDVLVGVGGSDYLESGQGDDRLFNSDNLNTLADDNAPDILVGGAGFDTYYAGLNDIIRDSDGRGEIRINGQPIPLDDLILVSGTTDLFTNNDPNNPTRFRQFANGDLQLIGSFVTVQGFQNGDLGITLDGTAPTPNLTIINGTSGDDLDTANQAVTGTSADEELHGLGGNDDVFGMGGQDVLFGEGGDDRLISEESHDVLDGGDGQDILISKAGKDILIGGIGDDLLVAGLDDDFLQGDEGNDALAGGAGTDTLFGGDGNDVLWGDGTYSVPDRTWNVSVTSPSAHTVTVTLDGIIGDISSSDDRADLLDGGAGDDVLFGAGGNDQLYGGDDNDFLIGGAGIDRLEGGTGNDNLFGDDGSDRTLIGNDILLGGDGNDFLQGGYGDDELDGGAGDDEIHGDYVDDSANGGNDVITAGDGNDIVLAGAGDDVIDAGTGDDYVDGGQGIDTILAGDGTDSVTGGDGNDTIFGDAGSDTLEGNAGDDSLDGGDGNDVLFGNDGIDQLSGGAGLDSLLGGTGDDTLSGGDDSDQLAGGSGNDVMHGDGGDDNLFGEDGDDTMYGDAGNDRLQGGIGSDQLFGGDGSDILIGEADDDTLSGGTGNDELQGNDGNDVLQGEAGNDLLIGQVGDDVLDGSGGDDDLQGGDGTDFLYGGQGADTLTGGLGNDTYQFNRRDGADNVFDEGGTLDVLSLGLNILAGDISITTQGSDLAVTLLDGGLPTADTMTLTNWFNADNQIESIQFNDGTVWDVAAIQSRLPEEIALVDGLNAQGSSNVTTYTFTPGTDNADGFNITVTDAGGLDTLQFEQVTDTTSTATPSLTGYSRDGNDLVLDVTVVSGIGTIPGGSGQIRLQDYYTSSGFIENITFPNGSLNDPNQAPVVNTPPTDQIAAVDTAFSYTLPTDTFSDSPFDVLTFSTSLADGSQLPAWLSFDAATLTFSGTPTSGDSAFLDINVMARDSSGLTATAGFGLNVGNINLAPTVANPIEDQTAKAQETFSFTLPADTFSDRNLGDTLTYSAVLTGGDPLPGWLSFDSQTGTFSGTPSDLDVNLLYVQVTATDSGSLSAADNFALTVNPYNSAPVADPDFANLVIPPAGEEKEFIVSGNYYVPDSFDSPVIGKLTDGGFLVAWDSVSSSQGTDSDDIVGQRYDANGAKAGSEFIIRERIGDNTVLSQPSMAELTNGDLIMVWTEDTDIYGQRMDGSGQVVGSAFLISSNNANTQDSPRVEGLANGGFVVVWQSAKPATGDSNYTGVSAQLFDSTANKTGSEFLVNTTTQSSEGMPDITAMDTGFVVAWQGSPSKLQQFDLNGNPIGNETTFGLASIDIAINPRIVELKDGSFITLYTDSDHIELHADHFDAAGNYQESYLVNGDTRPGVFGYDAIPLDDGGFVVTYSALDPQGHLSDDRDIFAAQFDTSGNVTTFSVSNSNTLDQCNAAITELNDGSLAFIWANPPAIFTNGNISAHIIPPAVQSNSYLVDVLVNDTDIYAGDNASTFTLTDAAISEGAGTVSIENNQIRFDASAEINSLSAGQTAQVVIDYTMADGGGETSSSTLTLLFQGSSIISTESLAAGAILQGGGRFVNDAGDVNGDGFSDVLVVDSSTNTIYTVLGQSQQIGGLVDLSTIGSDTTPAGFTLDGTPGEITNVASAGDVNGDGVDDLIIGAPFLFADPSDTSYPGQAYVVFGNASGLPSDISLANLNGANGFSVSGLVDGGRFGSSVGAIGDFSNDGVDDMVIAAPNVVNGTTGTTGEEVVIFGSTLPNNGSFDVQTLDGSNGFVISGVNGIGYGVSNVGDINNDGFNDLIIGNPSANGYMGEAYVVYGQEGGFNHLVDLRNLDGSNGLVITGGGGGTGAGDVNGDDIDDISIRAGSSIYIVYGQNGNQSGILDLANLDSSSGFRITLGGQDTIMSVTDAGDVNGDGMADMVVGANVFPDTAGDSFVVFGQAGGVNQFINLDTLDGTNGFHLPGLNPGDAAGISVSGAGDVNGDGFDDIVIGAPGANAGGGESYIIYGRDFTGEADYIGSTSNDIVNVIESNQRVFSLDGNDIINISNVADVTVNTGAGDDTVNLDSVDNANVTTGTGNNSINISGSSSIGTSTTTINSSQGSGTQTTVTTTASNRYVIVSPSLNGGGGQVYDVYTQQQISASDVILRKGSMIVDLLGGQVEFHFEGVNTNSLANGPVPFDKININNTLTLTYGSLLAQGFDIDGTVGDDVMDGTEVTDRITGYRGDDILSGGNGDDILVGGEGVDTLRGGVGNDNLNGGSGDDILMGGVGDDTYIYHAGDSSDTINDSSGVDQVIFGSEINANAMTVKQVDNNLIVSLSGTDQIVITDWFANSARHIERFVFTDNTLILFNAEQMERFSANHPPVVNAGIPNQATDEDAPFSFTILANAFTDPDPGDVLSYSVAMAAGKPLPNWLGFDTDTRTFSGISDNNDVGAIDIAVTATDPVGESATDSFRVVVNNVNDAPVLVNPVQDQATDEDVPFSFIIPANTFADEDAIHGDSQAFSVTLADGSVLPAWLQFDQLTRTLSGTPGNDDVSVDELQVTVADSDGLTASDVFRVIVNNVNDPPMLASPIPDQNTWEGDNFLFSIPAVTFKDIDVGDSLKLSATMEDGSVLPEWLKFQSDTGLFSGYIPYDAAGFYSMAVTAIDQSSEKVSDVFTLTVTNVINGSRRNNLLRGTDHADVINGYGGNDRLFGKAGNDVLNSGGGNDRLYGEAGNDTLDGGNGNDVLFDRYGDNNFNGGTGSDRLYGGSGDDVYNYDKGDGRDRIRDSGGHDTLWFGSGVKLDDIEFRRHGRNLVLEIADKHDRIVIDDWYRDKSKIESFSFEDGTVLIEKQVQQLVQSMSGYGIHRQGHMEHAEHLGMEENSKWFAVNWNYH